MSGQRKSSSEIMEEGRIEAREEVVTKEMYYGDRPTNVINEPPVSTTFKMMGDLCIKV